jgi:peptidyl-prolyl cis-trans isomerase B (cyclophilin B)
MPNFFKRRSFLSHLALTGLLSVSALSTNLALAADSATQSTSKPTEGKNSMSTQPRVKLSTNFGDMIISVDAAKAPKTAENFIAYVKDGFYDGTIFHRVMDGFMIQGGGFEPGMKQKTTKAPIENEANNGLKNNKYTLAMARTSDPHSATGQFFINVANNDFLNFSAPTAQGWGYAVFGEVVEGQDVVDKIKAVKTGNSGFHQNVPTEDVIITKSVVLE